MEVGGFFSDFGAILTESVSAQVCRSLFEAHKLLFSFLMTIKIMMGDDRVDALE